MMKLSETKVASSGKRQQPKRIRYDSTGQIHPLLQLLAVAAVACWSTGTTTAFLVPRHQQSAAAAPGINIHGTASSLSSPINTHPMTTTTTTIQSLSIFRRSTRSSNSRLCAKIPKIDEWEVLKSGAVRGTISNHPTLPDGYEITTSPLDETQSKLQNNAMVVTSSGSKYRLLNRVTPKEKPAIGGSVFGGKRAGDKKSNNKKDPAPEPPKKKQQQQKPPKVVSQKTKPQPKKKVAPVVAAAPAVNYDLNGKVVGSGKDNYLLVGNLIRSSSKRSQIYYAYKADGKDGTTPTGSKLTVKLTNSLDRLTRENKNYNRVFSNGRVAFSLEGSNSCFMKKVGFIPTVDESPNTKGVPKGSSALVLESGDKNLRTFLSESKGGLDGRDLRKASVNICRCVEAMHSSGLVWTDLKAENFVLVGEGGDDGYVVKGIDLESAVPVGNSPEDYSPEASPPEFAAAEKAGAGYEFECRKNYDVWSLGMLFYELAVGRNYFRGKSEDAILNVLGNVDSITEDGTVKGLEAIEDENFRDLVKSCLSIDSKKRPSILQILLHPYFLSTGFGPLAF